MLNKIVPSKPYLAPGYDLCWVCHVPIALNKFNLDKEACDMCVMTDMKDEIKSKNTEITDLSIMVEELKAKLKKIK